ncbi:MAG: hypothetical protein ACREBE_10390 [bacterium]
MQLDWRRRLRHLALAAGIAAAAGGLGCNSSSSTHASGMAEKEYFPLVAGARWRYKLALEIGTAEVEVVARGDSPVEGLPGVAFVMDEHALGAETLGIAEVGPTAYVARDGFLCRYTGLDYRSPDHLKMLGQEDPARVMPIGGGLGQEWTNQTRLLQQPENGGGGLIKWTGRTKRVDTITVPAGEFKDVLLVETEYWDETISKDGPLLAYEDYYARGVGLLRSVTKNLAADGAQMAEQTLLDFDFPEVSAQGS